MQGKMPQERADTETGLGLKPDSRTHTYTFDFSLWLVPLLGNSDPQLSMPNSVFC